ncbi:pyridoxamine 5'-phosphate oxidase family protein [Microtetraspora fusca]|uniref:Pyridoxamine 5'-phosphate oxidase family protein n=1 Tax=Microtetraspora fusca TaxID=1997 RepID=A0ABW6UY04_MICFU|nr:pyridoxamine 5'-phosphate oxidase family protein [Microtetraspora fusca]
MNERELRELPQDESLRLLASVAMGRVVFTLHALPAIRPVNHILDNGDIIIRTHLGAAITSAAADGDGTVVAYEADAIDPHDHLGWSVIVVGTARLVRDRGEIERYSEMLRPWVFGNMDHVIRIRPEVVTGFRLTPLGDPAPSTDR